MKQIEKIFMLMCFNRNNQKWWYPPMFMKPELGQLLVGYEASARLSDLAREYPTMIESRKRGKYKWRRIGWEDIDQWLPTLPENMQDIEKRYRPGGTQ